MHKHWGVSSYYLEQSLKSYHNIFILFGIFFLPIGSLDLLIACFIRWCFFTLLSFCNLLILNIVWFPPSICHWIRAFDSTHIMRNAHILEELSLYWPSRSFAHFGNGCQWGRSLEGLREFGLLLLALCLSICHSCFASCCFA